MMSHPLYVAFIWHQHQPIYKSRRSGQYHLPWVRLHGTKDYLDLVLLLERYPRLHQTVNLVPSLLLQLEDYAAGVATDPYLELARSPVEQLDATQKAFIIEHFFDANYHHLIAPHWRYRQLYEQRHERGRAWCLKHWQDQDYSDLLAWHNLAWIDPLFWDDPAVRQWLTQAHGFTLDDRCRILAKQQEIIRRIIPQHCQMQKAGQLEVMTSPYTHPILPLLADTEAGRVAVPNMHLPHQRFQWPEDIPRHLKKAWNLYKKWFGCRPRGLWPSEQSVSPAILAPIAQQGFQWICSDEAVLGWTLRHLFPRDETGNLEEPEVLYRPYRLPTPAGDLAIVFRDHRLSDLIGFTYGATPPQEAAADLVGHLEAIARTLKHRQAGGGTALDHPWLVTIALDGENCWEFYQQDGKPFLEALYGTLSHHPHLQLVTVSEFLKRFPPTMTLPSDRLHSGSWVDGSFTTWIGDPAKNRAWDLLTDARRVLAAHPEATERKNPAAWEALYAAEGSDWFWWFGAGHSANQDAMFDQLFREHLCALYEALKEPIPAALHQPVEDHKPVGDHPPQSFIHPVINGWIDEQDWDHAGRIEIGGARGTMHRSSHIQRLWYGVDHLNFYLRFDFQLGRKPGVDFPPELNLFWFYPDQPVHTSKLPLLDWPDQAPLNYRFRHHLCVNLVTHSIRLHEAADGNHWYARNHRAHAAIAECLEIAVPWADLNTKPDWSLQLVSVLSEEGRYHSFLPEHKLVSIQAP